MRAIALLLLLFVVGVLGFNLITFGVAFARGPRPRGLSLAFLKELGANLRQEYEGTSLDALRQMTALDMGVSFLPALYVRSEVSSETGDVAVLSFRKDRFTRSVGLVWRRRSAHGKVIERIAETVREVAEERFKGLVTME